MNRLAPAAALAISLAACAGAAPSPGGFSFGRDLGVATADEGGLCLRIGNASIVYGARVTLFSTVDSAVAAHATVDGARAEACPGDSDADPADRAYRLTGVEPGFYVAAVGEHRISKSADGRAVADVDGDGRSEEAHACASAEGLHLSIWTGPALRGRLRWHRYVYLGYDTEPTCRPEAVRDP